MFIARSFDINKPGSDPLKMIGGVLGGALVWTIGFLVPILWHTLLMNAAVQETGYTYSYHVMVKYFFTLPWIIWPYLIAMTVVGICLVVSGMNNKD